MVLNFSVLQTAIREGLGRERLMAALSGCYGLLAAVLCVVGLYGIMSCNVQQRTGEIGIRMGWVLHRHPARIEHCCIHLVAPVDTSAEIAQITPGLRPSL
jgi:hypothetical protein